MLLCCCSITNSDCVTRSDLSGIRGSKLLCLPLEVGDMTDRVVTNVDFDPEGIRRITVAGRVWSGHTDCGLAWFRYPEAIGITVPLHYEDNTDQHRTRRPWYPDGDAPLVTDTGPCPTKQAVRGLAADGGADLDSWQACYQTYTTDSHGRVAEKTCHVFGVHPDEDWGDHISRLPGAWLRPTEMTFSSCGLFVGSWWDEQVGDDVTVAAQIPEPMAAPTWERWSRMAAAMTTVGGRR